MTFFDGYLLDKAQIGERESVMALCEYLAQCFDENCEPAEGAMTLLQEILEKISKGESPDTAFRWKQRRRGNRVKNTAFRNWEIKMAVRALLIAGYGHGDACFQVSSEADGPFLLGQKTIKEICAGLTKTTPLPLTDDIFPLNLRYKKSEMQPTAPNADLNR